MPTFNATHHALFNMDILDNVIINIHDANAAFFSSGKDNGPATLARVARVCKSFHDFALDELWRVLPDFMPIFTLYHAIISSTDLKDQGLERLFYYTRRTRWIAYGKENAPEYDTSNIHRIHKLCRGAPLFPSLHLITLRSWPLSVSEADLLFSPGLRSIYLLDRRKRCPSKLAQVQQEQMCIHMLVRRCPTLLHFVSHLPEPLVSMQLLDPIFSLAGLDAFVEEYPSSNPIRKRGEWLEKVSRMRCLRMFHSSTIGLLDDAVSKLDLGSFGCLESLRITGSVTILSSLFRSMRSPLKVVSITTDAGEDRSSTRDCLQSLVHNSGKQLTEFSLYPTYDPCIPISSLSFVLGPLTQIHTLKHLIITVPCLITDYDITVFAKAWPNLRSIEIPQYSGSKADSSMAHAGFRALIELAIRCPDLDYIQLASDLNSLPPFEEVPDAKHNLGEMEIRGITSDDEEHLQRIANIVHRMFPRIKTEFDPEYTVVKWARVLLLVGVLQNLDNHSEHVADA